MKTLINIGKLAIIAVYTVVALVSCSSIDVMVDKSQLKTENATHAFYPSTAVSPVVNTDELNLLIAEGVAKANQSLRDATK